MCVEAKPPLHVSMSETDKTVRGSEKANKAKKGSQQDTAAVASLQRLATRGQREQDTRTRTHTNTKGSVALSCGAGSDQQEEHDCERSYGTQQPMLCVRRHSVPKASVTAYTAACSGHF